MRVLRLCSAYEAPAEALDPRFDPVGGMQVHTARLTAALDERGVAQHVVTAARPPAARLEPVGTSSMITRVGVPVSRLRQLYSIAALRELARARPDLVHAHLGEDVAVGALAAWVAARTSAPLVLTLHCSVRHTVAGRDVRRVALRAIGGPIEARASRRAEQVLVLSDGAARRVISGGVAPACVRVVPLGLDLEMFRRPMPRPRAMATGRWIVFAGRLVREKGVHELLGALTHLRDVSLLVIGDGAERATLARLAASLGLQRRMRLVGARPHVDVVRYLQHADAVAVPSWYEERGRVVLEAMACGVPVVATAVGGIAETIDDGENGLLVPVRDPVRLAVAIDRVLRDGGLAARLAANGRLTVERHDLSALVDSTLDAYDIAMRRRRSLPRSEEVISR